MIVNLEKRNAIAQLFVDMEVGDTKPVRKMDMVPILKEVNDTAIIGHAIRFVTNKEGEVIALKKYRKTAIERRIENKTMQ